MPRRRRIKREQKTVRLMGGKYSLARTVRLSILLLAASLTYAVAQSSAAWAAPVFTSLSPSSGDYATSNSVTVTGTGFVASTAATINGVSAPVSYVSATSVTVQIPASTGAGLANLVLSDATGSVTASGAYIYTDATHAVNEWTGAVDGVWENASNWSLGTIPSATDIVSINHTSTTQVGPTVDMAAGDVTVYALALGTNSGVANRQFVSANSKTNTFRTTSDIAIGKFGVMTHAANGATHVSSLVLGIAGSLTVDVGGTVDVIGKGYRPGGLGATGSRLGASHAGYGSGYTPVYGSIREPVDLGSSGDGSNAGGGAVRITTDGIATINGSIMAGTTSSYGSGGSIWITSTELAGSGAIASEMRAGSGGRIALYADSSSFSGTTRNGVIRSDLINSAGTTYTKLNGQPNGDLKVDGNGFNASSYCTPEMANSGESVTYDSLTITGGGRYCVPTGVTVNVLSPLIGGNGSTAAARGYLTVDGTLSTLPSTSLSNLLIQNNGVLNVANNTTLTNTQLYLNGSYSDQNPIIGSGSTVELQNTLATDDSRRWDLQSLTVQSGAMVTHKENTTIHQYSLNINISGNLSVESGGSINVVDKGYQARSGPGGGDGSYSNYAAHGGDSTTKTAYGSITQPTELGSGGRDRYSGGAIKLTVGGATVVNGALSASSRGCATGGSLWLTTDSLSGSGSITAAATNCYSAGGRVAVYANSSAYSGTYGSYGARVDGRGSGTTYLKLSASSNGDLIINNNNVTTNYCTPEMAAPGTSVTYDSITVSGGAKYCIPAEVAVTTAALIGASSGSLGSVQNNGTLNVPNGTVLTGINFANNGVYSDQNPVIGNNATFEVQNTLTFDDAKRWSLQSLTIQNKGTLTHPTNGADHTSSLNMYISGNLTVEAGGSINLSNKGLTAGAGYTSASAASHGGVGRGGISAYGSIRQPVDLGSRGGSSDRGGGAMKVIVEGEARVDGSVDVGATSGHGSGGSIWIDALTLSGNGTISSSMRSGSGGRIALYADESTFTGALSNAVTRTDLISAPGTIFTNFGNKPNGDLTIDGGSVNASMYCTPEMAPAGASVTYDRLTVTGRGNYCVPAGVTVNVAELFGGGTGTAVTQYGTVTMDGVLNLPESQATISNVTVQNNGIMSVADSTTWTNSTLLLNGAYPDQNPVIGEGGTIEVQNTLVTDDSKRWTVNNMTIQNGAVLTHKSNTDLHESSLNLLVLGRLDIQSGGKIDVAAKGYGEESGPGQEGGMYLAAIHGGQSSTEPGAELYGSIRQPLDLGSGGNQSGGGAVKLVSSNDIVINGTIGANGDSDGFGGSGSGGSIYIEAPSISGLAGANIQSQSTYNNYTNSSGSGGRIAIYADTSEFLGNISAFTPSASGIRAVASGTIYTKSPIQQNGSLIIDNGGVNASTQCTPEMAAPGEAVTYDELTITRGGRYCIPAGVTVNVLQNFNGGSGTTPTTIGNITNNGVLNVLGEQALANLSIQNNGTLTVPDGTTLTNTDFIHASGGVFTPRNLTLGSGTTYTNNDSSPTKSWDVTGVFTMLSGSTLRSGNNSTEELYSINLSSPGLDTIDIQSGATIDVNGLGYASGSGPGAPSQTNHGGSYGGLGAPTDSASIGAVYGSEQQPESLGSGAYAGGGQGGGAIKLHATNTVTIDGSVTANGTTSSNRGGSGGSIWVKSKSISGSGTVQANGGNGSFSGGGGRVAFEYDNNFAIHPPLSITSGGLSGGDKTILSGVDISSGAEIKFGDNSANFILNPDGSATITTPAHTAPGPVDVSISQNKFDGVIEAKAGTTAANDGTVYPSSNAEQLYTIPDGFTYIIPAPTVSSLSPNSGPARGGTTVTITGSNFSTPAAESSDPNVAAASNGATATGSSSDSSRVPSNAIDGDNNSRWVGRGGTGQWVVSSFAQEEYISKIAWYECTSDPSYTPREMQLQLLVDGSWEIQKQVLDTSTEGTGEYNLPNPLKATAMRVYFNNAHGWVGCGEISALQAKNISVSFGDIQVEGVAVNANKIEVTTPPHVPGLVDVTVHNMDGQSATLLQSFEYLAPPSVTGITPNTGPFTGGDTAIITGTGFRDGATVKIGNAVVAPEDIISITDTTITIRTPANNYGKYTVTVTNPDSQIGLLEEGYTYVAPTPTITEIYPAYGPEAGGQNVTITGTNLNLQAPSATTTWTATGTSMPTTTGYANVMVIGDAIYSYGGRGASNTISSAPVSDPTNWTNTGKKMPTSYNTEGSNVYIVDDTIYFAGGLNGSTHTGTIMSAPVSDPTNVTLHPETLPISSSVGAVHIIEDRVYIFGGFSGSGGSFSNSIMSAPVSDPTNFTLHSEQMPTGMAGPNSLRIGDKLYIFGSRSTNKIYEADVSNPLAWRESGATVPGAMAAASVFVVGDTMYLVTGYISSAVSHIYEANVGDPLTWTRSSQNFPVNLYGGNPLIIDETMYIMGGISNANIYSSPITGPTAPNVLLPSHQTNWTTDTTLPPTTEVWFGDVKATNVVVVDGTTITATTPEHDPALVDVSVVIRDGQRVTLPQSYAFIPSALTFVNEPYLRSLERGLAATEPGHYTIQALDVNGEPIVMPIDIIVDLTTTSVGGQFARTGNDDPDPDGTRWDYNTVVFKAGSSSAEFWYRDTIQGTPTITASIKDPLGDQISTASQQADIGSRFKLRITGIADPIKRGVESSVTVRVVDWKDEPLTGYVGTIRFGSTDLAATLPAEYTFKESDTGVKTFTNGVVLQTQTNEPDEPGTCVTVTDTVDSTISGKQCDITVLAPNMGTPAQLKFTTPEQSFPSNGYSGPITAQIQDVHGEGVLMEEPRDVWFVTDSTTGQFTLNPQTGPWLSGPFKGTIGSGLTSTTVYYRDTAVHTSTLSVRDRVEDTADNGEAGDFGLTNDTQQAMSGVGLPTRIAIYGPSRLEIGEKGRYRVEIQDENGNPTTVTEDTLLRIDGVSDEPFNNETTNPATARFYFAEDDFQQAYRGPVHFYVPAGSNHVYIMMSDTTPSTLPTGATQMQIVDARPSTQIIRLEDQIKRVVIGVGDPVGTEIRILDPATGEATDQMPVRKNVEVRADYIDIFGNYTYVEDEQTHISLETDSLGAWDNGLEPGLEFDLPVEPSTTGSSVMYYAFGAGKHTITGEITETSGVPEREDGLAFESEQSFYYATPIKPRITFPDRPLWVREYTTVSVGFFDIDGNAITLDAPRTVVKVTSDGPASFYNAPYTIAKDQTVPSLPIPNPNPVFVNGQLVFEAGQGSIDLNFVGEDLGEVIVTTQNDELKTMPVKANPDTQSSGGMSGLWVPPTDPDDPMNQPATTDNGVQTAEETVEIVPGPYHEIALREQEASYIAGEPKMFHVVFLDRNGFETTIKQDTLVKLQSTSSRGFFSLSPDELNPDGLAAVDPTTRTNEFTATPNYADPDRKIDYLEVYYYDETAGRPQVTISDITAGYPEVQPQDEEVDYTYACGLWTGYCPSVDPETQLRMPADVNATTLPMTPNLENTDVQNPQIREHTVTWTVTPNVPFKATYMTSDWRASIYAPSDPILVGLLDRFGNITFAREGGLKLRISTTSSTGGFALNANATEADYAKPYLDLDFIEDQATATVHYMDTESGDYQLTVGSDTIVNTTEPIRVTEPWLQIESSWEKRPLGFENKITVRTTDIFGNIYTNRTPKTVYLFSDSPTGKFSTTFESPLTGNWGATDLVVPAGKSEAVFYAKETVFQPHRDEFGQPLLDEQGEEIPKNTLKVTASASAIENDPTNWVSDADVTFEILSQPVERIVYINDEYTIKAGEMTGALVPQAQRWDTYLEDWVPSIQRGDSSFWAFTGEGGDIYAGVGEEGLKPDQNDLSRIMTCVYLDEMRPNGYSCNLQHFRSIRIMRNGSTINTYYAGYKAGQNRVSTTLYQNPMFQPRGAEKPADYKETGVFTATTNANPHYVNVEPGPAAAMDFVTPERTVRADQTSSDSITVTFRDKYGNVTEVGEEPLDVQLVSSCATGKFSLTQDPFEPITHTVIESGSTSFTFYYQDTVTGDCTISVSGSALAEGTQTIRVNPGAPVRMEFVDEDKTIIKGEPYRPAVEMYDIHNNVAWFTENTSIWVTTTSETGTWNGVGATVEDRYPPQGVIQKTYKLDFTEEDFLVLPPYIDRTVGTNQLSLTDYDPAGSAENSEILGDTMQVEVVHGTPTNLGFTPDQGQMRAGGVWETKVQILNEWMVPVEATEQVVVNLASSNSHENTKFLSSAEFNATEITQITIESGQSEQTIGYTQEESGTSNLTAAADGFGDGPATVRVLPASVHEIRFLNEPYVGSNALEIGEEGRFTLELYDVYGNVTTPGESALRVYLTAILPDGTVLERRSIEFGTGSSIRTFTMTREEPELAQWVVSTSENLLDPEPLLPTIEQDYEVVYGNPSYHGYDNHRQIPSWYTKQFERGEAVNTSITLYNRFDRIVPAPAGGQSITISPEVGGVSESDEGPFAPTMTIIVPEGQTGTDFWYSHPEAHIATYCTSRMNEAYGRMMEFCSLRPSQDYDIFLRSYLHRIPSTTNPANTGDHMGTHRYVPYFGAVKAYRFITEEQTIYARHTSAPMQVEAYNQYNIPTRVLGFGEMLYVRSNAGGNVSEFGNSGTDWGVNMIHLPPTGSRTQTFVYRDSVEGVKRLVVGDTLPLDTDPAGRNAVQNITILRQILDHLLVTNISDPTKQGVASSVVVMARDSAGYIVDWYDGTINFSAMDQVSSSTGLPVETSDPSLLLNPETNVMLPSTYTFDPAVDKGEHTFINQVSFGRLGEKTVIATDTGTNSQGIPVTGRQIDITVESGNSAPVQSLAFSQPESPAQLVKGVASPPITLEIRDANGVPTMAPIGGMPVRLTSSSPTAQFSLSPNGPWVSVLDATVPEGFTFINFYYRDTAVGEATITGADWNGNQDNPAIQNASMDVAVNSVNLTGTRQIYSRNVFGEMEPSELLFSSSSTGEIHGAMESNFKSFDLATNDSMAVDWRWYWRQGVFLHDQEFDLIKLREIQKDKMDIATMIGEADFYTVAQATDTTFDNPDEVVSLQQVIPTGKWRNEIHLDNQLNLPETIQYVVAGQDLTGRVDTYQALFEDIQLHPLPMIRLYVIPADTTNMQDAITNAVYQQTFMGPDAQQTFTITGDMAGFDATTDTYGKRYRILSITYNTDGHTTSQSLSGPFEMVQAMPTCESLGLIAIDGSDGLYPNCQQPAVPPVDPPVDPPAEPEDPVVTDNPEEPRFPDPIPPIVTPTITETTFDPADEFCSLYPEDPQCNPAPTDPDLTEEEVKQRNNPLSEAPAILQIAGANTPAIATGTFATAAAMMMVLLVWDIYREIRNVSIQWGILKRGRKESYDALALSGSIRSTIDARIGLLLGALRRRKDNDQSISANTSVDGISTSPYSVAGFVERDTIKLSPLAEALATKEDIARAANMTNISADNNIPVDRKKLYTSPFFWAPVAIAILITILINFAITNYFRGNLLAMVYWAIAFVVIFFACLVYHFFRGRKIKARQAVIATDGRVHHQKVYNATASYMDFVNSKLKSITDRLDTNGLPQPRQPDEKGIDGKPPVDPQVKPTSTPPTQPPAEPTTQAEPSDASPVIEDVNTDKDEVQDTVDELELIQQELDSNADALTNQINAEVDASTQRDLTVEDTIAVQTKDTLESIDEEFEEELDRINQGK